VESRPPGFRFRVLGTGYPGRQAAAGPRSKGGGHLLGVGALARGDCEYERLVNRGPSAAAGGVHKISKKKVYVLRLLGCACPYSAPTPQPWGCSSANSHARTPIPLPLPLWLASGARRGQKRDAKKGEGWSNAFICRSFSIPGSQPRILGSPVGSPVFRKNLGGSILARMVAPVVAQHKKGLACSS